MIIYYQKVLFKNKIVTDKVLQRLVDIFNIIFHILLTNLCFVTQ